MKLPKIKVKTPDAVQIAGMVAIVAAAFLLWGLAAGLATAGLFAIAWGVLAERSAA